MSENTPVNSEQIEPTESPEEMGGQVSVTNGPTVEAVVEPEVQAAQELGIGEVLRTAREKAGLSISDIAYRFKLGAQQVEFIESEQWDRLPGRTFIRGIVRSYARELHLDSEALLARLLVEPTVAEPVAKIVPDSTPAQPADVPKQTAPRDKLIVAGGLLVLLLAVLVYFLLPEDLFEDAPVAANSAGPVVEAGQGSTTLQPVVVPLSEGKPATDAAGKPTESATSTQPVTLPAVTPASPAPGATTAEAPKPATPPVEKEAADKATAAKLLAAGGVSLKVKFSETSWVEVRDKSGNVIFSHTGAAGAERDVVGMAPLSLHIGNAAGVKLEYKGKPVDLAPHIRNNIGRVKLD